MPFRLSGEALLDTGAPATAVVVRAWGSHAHVAQAVPDAVGAWEVQTASAGPFDVTTYGPTGYQPVIHGPIAAEVI